ncbi:hypothetical protein [Teredinibacter turnerae]|uniref:hypothetical protein n=1 Tax=Teredinibacter turnerae TaxID=2426 RepID=UPI00036B0A91|nr:hypothetical protein [Teredinibacter turnerae]
MINYRQIGNLQEQIFDQIGAAESFRSFVYHDSVGVPTLGYGFALLVRDESDRYVIRDDLSGALSAIDIEIDGEFQNTLDEAIDLLNAGNVAGSSSLFPSPNANIADDPSLNTMGITIDENHGRTLFNYAAASIIRGTGTNKIYPQEGNHS